MAHLMTDSTNKGRSMAEASSHGLMEAPSLEISLTTIFMEQVFTNGLTGEYSMESGKIIRWKVMGPSLGPMAGNTWDNILMT